MVAPTPEPPPGPPPRSWRQIAVWLLAVKVLTFILIFLCLNLLPRQFQTHSFLANFHYPPGKTVGTADVLSTWDAQHYLYLAQVGSRSPS